MLVLTRKANESLIIDGRLTIRILRIDGDSVKVGVEGPSEVQVHRAELYDEIQRNNREAIRSSCAAPVTPIPSNSHGH